MSQSDPPSDADAELPVLAASSRTYFEVRPTDDPLDPSTVETHVRRLHRIGQSDKRGFLDVLRRRTSQPPTVECLLVSDGGPDATIRYLFGIDPEDAVETLGRVLRSVFPDAFEFERVRHAAEHLQGLLGDETDSIAAVEFGGQPERRADWQTRLKAFEELTGDDHAGAPLASVVETMAAFDQPMVYQALLEPKPDWSAEAEQRRLAIETRRDTAVGQLTHAIWGPPGEDQPLPASERTRLAEIDERDTRHSFVVNARVVAVGAEDDDPNAPIRELALAFSGVSHTCYEIEGSVSQGSGAQSIREAIHERSMSYSGRGLTGRLPWTGNTTRAIVADASEAPNFCLLGGGALNAAGARALAPTPGERTALPRPPIDQLTRYRGDGLVLGRPLTQDGTADPDPLVLPPALQSLHVGWFGKTGSGKSTSLLNAILANHDATDGADLLIDPKGDGMPLEYLRAHYATYGTLENVVYFDCASVLPAFSFFDIRDELDAGISRTTAVEDRADHYLEILTQIMGRERFEQAVRSPDVIRYLVKAMFDPVSGDDAFAHRELHTAVRQMHERQTAPAVADEDLERMLAGVVSNRTQSFDEIMQGVANRIEKIPVDRRLARVFNHVAKAGDPAFDLADFLDKDCVVVFDTGGLRSEAQRVLTLLILSNLWTALRRRATRESPKRPLVNLYIEEAAGVAVSDLLKELLSQARGFDCSVTLSMQFPGQLRDAETAYGEVLNNVSTFVTGNVPVDRKLGERLATEEMTPQQVGNRLRALRRGQWLVSLPAAFDEPEPRPFLVRSLDPPAGDPDGKTGRGSADMRDFEAARQTLEARTAADVGLSWETPSVARHESPSDSETDDEQPVRVDSALPHTNRLPETVTYRVDAHLLVCRRCGTRFDPDIDGMRAAIDCCSALDAVDRADVPVCDLNLKLTPPERAESEYADQQLMFLQAVYNAQQLRFDPLEYDLLADSMIRLQEYVGVDSGAVQDLIDDGSLTHDTDRPHRLFSVTPDGRSVIGERYRRGREYGHGKGDLEETSQHVLAAEVGRRYLVLNYVNDPDSPVVRVVPYFDLERDDPAFPAAAAMGEDPGELEAAEDAFDARRLDLAALDEEGRVVVAMEAERINHDAREAIPADFDKMADCNPDEAIWMAMSHAEAHEILAALNDPFDGEPRVEKTYSKSTPATEFRIDAAGCTRMVTLEQALADVRAAE